MTSVPSWRHPFRRLHHHGVERKLAPAVQAADDLGVPLDTARIRAALGYDPRGPAVFAFPAVLVAILDYLMVMYNKSGCTPGGRLTPEGGACTPWETVWTGLLGIAGFVFLVVAAAVVTSICGGECVNPTYQPLYPAFGLLRAAADLAGSDPAGRYTHTVELSRKAAELRQPLRVAINHTTATFGTGKERKATTNRHIERVQGTLGLAADDLLVNRREAAQKLGVLAATITNNLAHDRFTDLLPEASLPPMAALEPDRLDGRRLMKACRLAGILVFALAAALGQSGVDATILVPAGLAVWPVVSFLLLCHRHGLAEATRLIRSIRSLLPGNTTPTAP
ncbi:hypothetical protein [Kitasatospora sp. NPDC050463]|uniref:hypothetical protein n=1 Tax=Kitasatospora sp. NPDC050463 TaxID=3155786 RepID=UPI0033D10B36